LGRGSPELVCTTLGEAIGEAIEGFSMLLNKEAFNVSAILSNFLFITSTNLSSNLLISTSVVDIGVGVG